MAPVERMPKAWLSRWQAANENRISPVARRRPRMMRVQSCAMAPSGCGTVRGERSGSEAEGIALRRLRIVHLCGQTPCDASVVEKDRMEMESGAFSRRDGTRVIRLDSISRLEVAIHAPKIFLSRQRPRPADAKREMAGSRRPFPIAHS